MYYKNMHPSKYFFGKDIRKDRDVYVVTRSENPVAFDKRRE